MKRSLAVLVLGNILVGWISVLMIVGVTVQLVNGTRGGIDIGAVLVVLLFLPVALAAPLNVRFFLLLEQEAVTLEELEFVDSTDSEIRFLFTGSDFTSETEETFSSSDDSVASESEEEDSKFSYCISRSSKYSLSRCTCKYWPWILRSSALKHSFSCGREGLRPMVVNSN